MYPVLPVQVEEVSPLQMVVGSCLGFLFFALVLGVCLDYAWRRIRQIHRRRVRWARERELEWQKKYRKI